MVSWTTPSRSSRKKLRILSMTARNEHHHNANKPLSKGVRQECSQRCAADQFAGHCDGPNLNLCVLAAGFSTVSGLDFQKRHLQRLHERFHRRLELVDDTHCDPLPLLWVSHGTRRAPFQFLLPCAKQSVVLTIFQPESVKDSSKGGFAQIRFQPL